MVIYLNGVSSSGKSSIALELQKQLKFPLFYFSLDTYLGLLAPEILEAKKSKTEESKKWPWHQVGEGYFNCLAAFQKTGNWVIADGPVYTKEHRNLFQSALGDIQEKFVVGLNCPIDAVNRREAERKDREIGLAERQHPTIHEFLKYDWTCDSNKNLPMVLACEIVENLKNKGFY